MTGTSLPITCIEISRGRVEVSVRMNLWVALFMAQHFCLSHYPERNESRLPRLAFPKICYYALVSIVSLYFELVEFLFSQTHQRTRSKVARASSTEECPIAPGGPSPEEAEPACIDRPRISLERSRSALLRGGPAGCGNSLMVSTTL